MQVFQNVKITISEIFDFAVSDVGNYIIEHSVRFDKESHFQDVIGALEHHKTAYHNPIAVNFLAAVPAPATPAPQGKQNFEGHEFSPQQHPLKYISCIARRRNSKIYGCVDVLKKRGPRFRPAGAKIAGHILRRDQCLQRRGENFVVIGRHIRAIRRCARRGSNRIIKQLLGKAKVTWFERLIVFIFIGLSMGML